MQDNSEASTRTVAQAQLIFSKRHSTRGSAVNHQINTLSESSTSLLHVKNYATMNGEDWKMLFNVRWLLQIQVLAEEEKIILDFLWKAREPSGCYSHLLPSCCNWDMTIPGSWTATEELTIYQTTSSTATTSRSSRHSRLIIPLSAGREELYLSKPIHLSIDSCNPSFCQL